MNKKIKMAALALSACMALGVVCFTACEGTPGKSAYDIWLEQGNTGTEQDFLDSLKGAQGNPGTPGTPGTPGSDGKSAYELWLDAGNEGTEQQFLESLKGMQGNPGTPGTPGTPGEAGRDGNRIYHGEGNPSALNLAAVDGDMYIDTTDWHVYFFVDHVWEDCGSIKSGSAEPEPAGAQLDIQANGEQTVNVNLAEGIHVLIVDMGAATLTTGTLQAQTDEQISEFSLSSERSTAAGENHNIYCAFVNAKTEIKTLTFKTTGEAVKGDLTFEDYSAPTLKADGTYIEVPLTSYNNVSNDAIEINLDASVTAGSYNMTVSIYSYDMPIKVMVGTKAVTIPFTAMDWAITLAAENLTEANGKIHFEIGMSSAPANTIWYTTVKLTNA